MSNYKMQPATILYNPSTGVPTGFLGGDGKEYSVLFATVASSGQNYIRPRYINLVSGIMCTNF